MDEAQKKQQALEYLMDNARPRRNHQHVLECLGAPFQKPKPLLVPRELERHVLLHSVSGPSHIHLDRVIDDEVHRNLYRQTEDKS